MNCVANFIRKQMLTVTCMLSLKNILFKSNMASNQKDCL